MTIPVFVESLLKTISHSDAEKKKQDNKARYVCIQRNAGLLSDCLTFFIVDRYSYQTSIEFQTEENLKKEKKNEYY